MRPVESIIVIDRPIEACFASLTDLANDDEWRREWTTPRGRPTALMAWVPGSG